MLKYFSSLFKLLQRLFGAWQILSFCARASFDSWSHGWQFLVQEIYFLSGGGGDELLQRQCHIIPLCFTQPDVCHGVPHLPPQTLRNRQPSHSSKQNYYNNSPSIEEGFYKIGKIPIERNAFSPGMFPSLSVTSQFVIVITSYCSKTAFRILCDSFSFHSLSESH